MRRVGRQEPRGLNSRGGSWAWRQLRTRVLAEEPLCRLALPGCTRFSTTVDHRISRKLAPQLSMTRSNLQGACRSCNLTKGQRLRPHRRPTAEPPVATRRAAALAWFD
jgi:5-methylcytosine-specific restriction endonuclease McrA